MTAFLRLLCVFVLLFIWVFFSRLLLGFVRLPFCSMHILIFIFWLIFSNVFPFFVVSLSDEESGILCTKALKYCPYSPSKLYKKSVCFFVHILYAANHHLLHLILFVLFSFELIAFISLLKNGKLKQAKNQVAACSKRTHHHLHKN